MSWLMWVLQVLGAVVAGLVLEFVKNHFLVK